MTIQPSRYFPSQIVRSAGTISTEPSERFVYTERNDTRRHVVRSGDTLHNLAVRFFPNARNPERLWWVIADFQPNPILDPTLALEIGRVLRIPSESVVMSEALSDERLQDRGVA